MNPREEVTALLARWRDGEEQALHALMPLVYGDLRRLAQFHLRDEHAGHMIQATALVHDSYLRLVEQNAKDFKNRTHFFAVCSRVMRQVLVDHAREERALKRGGAGGTYNIEAALTVPVQPDVDILGIDESLTRLERLDSEKCRIVEMRFFGGLNSEEIADVLGIAAITVKRKWAIAKAWLYHDLKSQPRFT